MSASFNLGSFCAPGCGTATATASQQSTGDNKIGTSLITIILLILIVYFLGGRVFGGYGNYPGFGGYSMYGYTPYKPKRYRYFDSYLGFDEPDY